MKRYAIVMFVAWFAGSACGGSPPMPPGGGGGGGGGGSSPTISSITPTSGTAAGGTAVTIAGSNFATGTTVTIGNVALTGVTVTPTSITGTTAASSTAGPVTVTVNSGGQTATLASGFTYNSAPRAAITGAPTTTPHDTNVTFSGATSSTTTPYSINSYRWDCGQNPGVYGAGCNDVPTSQITPTFKYRRCSPAANPIAQRDPCDSGTQKTYAVRLTVTDTQGNQNTTTFNITVTNNY